jgi:hypothetical protein
MFKRRDQKAIASVQDSIRHRLDKPLLKSARPSSIRSCDDRRHSNFPSVKQHSSARPASGS